MPELPHWDQAQPLHVLWADSDSELCKELAYALGDSSFVFWTALDFAQARQILLREEIVLGCVNVSLAGESGFGVADWIRRHPSLYTMDLLFLSDRDSAHLYRETALLRFQALEYLDKPLELAALAEFLRQYKRGLIRPKVSPMEPHSLSAVGSSGVSGGLGVGMYEPRMDEPEAWVENDFAQGFEERPLAERQTGPLAAGAFVENLWKESVPSGIESLELAPILPRLPQDFLREDELLYEQESGVFAGSHAADSDEIREMDSGLFGDLEDHEKTFPKRNRPPSRRQVQEKEELSPYSAHAANAYVRGQQALSSNQLEQATQLFQEAFVQDPQPQYQLMYGWSLFFLDPKAHAQVAEEHLWRGLEGDPSNEQAYLLVGRVLAHQARVSEAMELYRYALQQDANFQEIYRELRLLELRLSRTMGG